MSLITSFVLGFTLILSASTAASYATVVIAEIFSNDKGSGSDRGKEWLELLNISEAPIQVSHLHLAVTHNKKTTASIEQAIKPAVNFRETLLIAQQKTLGLDRCLASPAIVVPDFSLPNSGELTICIELNHDLGNCATIDKKQKRPDGISLFREAADQNLTPLFLPEPCHLADGIFATPGIASRACAVHSNMADHVFTSCKNGQPAAPRIKTFFSESKQLDPSTIMLQMRDDVYQLSLHNNADPLPYLVTTCRSPTDDSYFCHTIEQHTLITGGAPVIARLSPVGSLERIFLRIRDMYGAVMEINLPAAQEPPPSTTAHGANINVREEWHQHNLSLIVTIALEELPINLSVIDQAGHVLKQSAALFSREVQLNVVIDEQHAPKLLRYSGIKNSGEIPLGV